MDAPQVINRSIPPGARIVTESFACELAALQCAGALRDTGEYADAAVVRADEGWAVQARYLRPISCVGVSVTISD